VAVRLSSITQINGPTAQGLFAIAQTLGLDAAGIDFDARCDHPRPARSQILWCTYCDPEAGELINEISWTEAIDQ
jgi:predicted protein tyrosine phosphatase